MIVSISCYSYKVYIMKLLVILLIISLNSCTKDFSKNSIQTITEFQAAKIDGNHNVYISSENFKLIKNIMSEDCESWALDLNFDNPIRNSIKNLSDKMFDSYSISKNKLSPDELVNSNFTSQISYESFSGISNFKTLRNTGVYEISLKLKVKVENSSKNIVNEISSNMNWEKNIFFDCNLHEGAVNSGQKALSNLMKKVYESTYESIYSITR